MSDTDRPVPSATRVTLRFRPPEHPASPDVAVRDDLSACARVGETLFLACDETTGVERLRLTAAGWGAHRHFDLSDFFDLPDRADSEVDIEGLHIDDGWFWITGSHALKRGKPDGNGGARGLRKLARIKRDGNRQFLGRLPLIDTSEGMTPVAVAGDRRAAHVRFTRNGKLRDWLAKDAHLAKFLDIPAKENGLDVEGIVARGSRVWLGLRGPVLLGHAIILEFDFRQTRGGHLKPRRIDGKARYRKHVLETDGHGVRDLEFDGDDMLILTGTPQTGEASAAILRWRAAAACRASGVHLSPAVTMALSLPDIAPGDNPEGLARWDTDTWLVVHDTPQPARLAENDASYHADIWRLTG